MMFSPPFFRSPFYRRFPSPYYSMPQSKVPRGNGNTEVLEHKVINDFKDNKVDTGKQEYLNNNSQVFNIMGITLYFDDILIICLLFFLYQEGVKDEMLFIALILLLLA